MEKIFRLSAPILELSIGGQDIDTTAEHPFYVVEKGWTPAKALEPGDLVLGHDGSQTEVNSVQPTDRHEDVFNVRVAVDHTYFVGSEDWGFSLWVHNTYSVNKLADGTFEIVDDLTNKVVKKLDDADAADAWAKYFNADELLTKNGDDLSKVNQSIEDAVGDSYSRVNEDGSLSGHTGRSVAKEGDNHQAWIDKTRTKLQNLKRQRRNLLRERNKQARRLGKSGGPE